MPTSVTWNDTAMTIAGSKLHLTRGGSGRPVLVLHHDIGTPERLPFYDALAQNFDVLIPHHPGWGKSERPQWLRSVRDIAAIHNWLLTDYESHEHLLRDLRSGEFAHSEAGRFISDLRKKFNAAHLAFFLLDPHPRMNLMLTRRETQDIAAYIGTLAK